MDDSNLRARPAFDLYERGSSAARAISPEPAEPMPLSPSQQHRWLSARTHAAPLQLMIAILRLRGSLDHRVLQAALDRILARHDVLRMSIRDNRGQPAVLLASIDARFPLVQQSFASDEAIKQAIQQESLAPFDLTLGPLIRGRLLQLSDHDHVLLITPHPIVADGLSMQVLARELSVLYSAYALGRDDPLPPLRLQYTDWARLQSQDIPPLVLEEQLAFWRRELTGAPATTQLPTDRVAASLRHYAHDRLQLKLSTAHTKRLAQFARGQRVSQFVTFMSAWAMLVGRWSDQTEVTIATRVTNRQPRETALMIGPFENTLALRIRVHEDQTVEQLLQQVRGVVAAALAHKDVPFEAVVEAVAPTRNGPLTLVHMSVDDTLGMDTVEAKLPDLKLTELTLVTSKTQLELLLSLSNPNGRLIGTLEYAAHLFERSTVEKMAECWKALLKGMSKHPKRSLDEISMLPANERELVLHRFNSTAAPLPEGKLVHQLFEEQAERTPQSVAVTHERQSLTYAQLNGRANQLARYLRESGVAANQLVGICVERSLEMVVGLLGILKAGAAYVPLDPSYPAERIAHMMTDAALPVVLTQQRLAASLPAQLTQLIELDTKAEEIEALSSESLSPEQLVPSAPQRVYVIYTSGSTGRPKGTQMAHRSMVNLIEWHRQTFSNNEGRRVLQFAALSFDVAFQEIFTTLSTGGTLVLLDEWMRHDTRALTEFMSRRSIQRLFVPPLVLQRLAEFTHASGIAPGSLQDVITAGEQLRITAQIAGLFKRTGGCQLHNHYGPTESHVVTSLTLTGDPDSWPALPAIGRPIANTQIYILDKRLQPVPVGSIGEIYIGGANVACGYLSRHQLTAERFLPDPFSSNPQARLYRSGDLGRWNPDGTVQYLGRNDDQVKIRGFRIELAEIEAQLAQHPDVKDSAVVARECVGGDKRLVAYVTPRAGTQLSAQMLRTFVRPKVPEHMVPSAFVVLDDLPVTPSGKLDRRALPAPSDEAYVRRPYAAPQGKTEALLAAMWQELLRIERVGRDDNFFELGGDSLSLARMMEQLRQVGLSAEVRDFFQSRSLAELASVLKETADEVEPREAVPDLRRPCSEPITPQMLSLVELDAAQLERIAREVPGGAANIKDIYPLAPLQEGLLFLNLLNERGGDAYVISTLLSVASHQRLKELIAALQSAIDRHDALRTAVFWEDLPRPVQIVYRQATLPVEEVCLDADRDATEQIDEWMQPERQRLDLRRAPLMRLQIVPDRHERRWYALLQLHHIVSDDTAQAILRSEVAAFLAGPDKPLPEPLPYRSFVAHALAHAGTRNEETFFRSKLAEIDEPTAPFGLLRLSHGRSRIVEAQQVLDPTLARRLRSHARRLQTSAATLFHAAWGLVVAGTSARDDVVFGSVLLGRLQATADGQRMVGMFINTLPVRLNLRHVTAGELLEQTRQELMDLLSHEQASLATAQRCSGIGGTAPLFTSLLNYRHGMPAREAEWMSVPGIAVLRHDEQTHYPITCCVDDVADGFSLTVQTDHSIDPDRLVSYLQTAVHSLVEALEQAPATPALALSMLPERERCQVVERFNANHAEYPQSTLLHELFEEWVDRAPDAIALAHGNDQLSYAALNGCANRVAHLLRAAGIGPDHRVGVCMERSLEMVIAVLGIMKAGGAYVPLDPHYPSERLQYMLEDAAPRVVLTQQRLKARLHVRQAELIAVDAHHKDVAGSIESLWAHELRLTPDNLIYVIYTSGTTGRPKGTAMSHRSMVNLIEWQRRTLPLRTGQCVLQFAALSFDVAFQEMLSTLCAGGTLVLVDEWVRRDPQALLELLSQQRIERLFVPPLMLQSLAVGSQSLKEVPRCLKDIITAGEQLRITPEIVQFFNRLGGARLHNHYGPTESHVVTAQTLSADPGREPALPTIGRPVANTQIYVLNEQRQPVPIGVRGEIYIGGANIARGYLNRPELTAQRFIADPFSREPGARLYRTGDLGKWQPDGTLTYLGRNDDQVKIRGYRIELGEIEAKLLQHARVREAVVTVREDVAGDRRLVAYVVADDTASPQVEQSAEAGDHQLLFTQLREHLSAHVPDHMIPSGWMSLKELPMTPSGKVDRRALPAPSRVERRDHHIAPRTEVERTLADIWSEVVGIVQIDVRDNFFDLGGHSLLAMQVMGRIRSAFSIELPMSALLESPTLEQLSRQIDALRDARLIESIVTGGTEMEELFEQIASMPESRVKELMDELRRRGVQ